MSDFIPPLISSSPPPIPDFDDEDDDVEFGLDYNIDLDLPEVNDNDVDKEKKNKLLEIDGRRLEINGTTSSNSWRCEEQDSTSQDSGLCMASQSSEGMSPLPQSDDEDKQNDTKSDSAESNMKHSSTIMFNPDESNGKSDNNVEFNDNTLQDTRESSISVNDTGQNDAVKPSNLSSSIIIENGESNENYESDNEYDLFKNHKSYQINSYDVSNTEITCNKTNGISNIEENSEIKNTVSSECDTGVEFSQFEETKFNDSSLHLEQDSEQCVSFPASSSAVCEVNGDDNNICDSSINAPDAEVVGVNPPEIYFNNVGQNVDCVKETANDNDEFDEDDEFGNFTSVTIPENCDVASNNSNSLFSCNNSVNEISLKNHVPCTKETGIPVHPEINLSDNIPGDDDEANFGSLTSETHRRASSDIANNCSTSCNAVTDFSKESDSREDDDFDDFSDFTQSTDLQMSTCQHPAGGSKDDYSSHSSLLHQDGFEKIFPKFESIDSNSSIQQLEHGPVWKYLCPLENSPALKFQWSNSRAHNRLLSALSIDSRNILFGPHWNSNIPRFAANLCSNPLQPVKAAEVPGGSSSPVPLALDEAAVVPDAHFDWVSSGLTNPLDSGTHSALLDLEILSTFDNLTTTNNSVGVTSKSTSDDIEQLNYTAAPSGTGKNSSVMSVEAESVISMLPDLNFMRKTYIEFLTNKD